MKKYWLTILIALMLLSLPLSAAARSGGPVTKKLPNTVLHSVPTTDPNQFDHKMFAHTWDLTACDLVLRYTIDLTGASTPDSNYPTLVAAGVGNPDKKNAQFPFGLLGGLWSSAPFAGASDPASLNLNDKHLLCHGTSCSDLYYDATGPDVVVPRFGTDDSYGIWFDRDGVDPDQAALWGAVSGVTYNTRGVYNVEITYHAVAGNTNKGTMFARINGVRQGFYLSGWKDQQPDVYPAGLSFTNDLDPRVGLANLGVMAMAYHYAESTDVSTIALTDISATGCLAR